MRFIDAFASASITLFTAILAVPVVHAQVDPSSALLLNSTGDTTDRESGIGSGRYTVRPKADGSRDTSRNVRSETSKPVVAPTSTPMPAPTPVPTLAPQATPPQKAPQAPPQQTQSTVTPLEAAAQQSPTQAQAAPVPTHQAQAPQDSQQAGQQAAQSALDNRLEYFNLIELSIAPGYLYNSSESSYSYRNYNASAPTVAVDAKVWIRPSIAIQTGYLSTLSASVSDSRDGSRSVTAAQQWFFAGVRSRNYLGASRMAPSLSASFDYYEYEFRAPSDAMMRAKLKSTGVRVSVDAELPVSPYRSWTLGFSVVPKLQHQEGSTSIDFKSGGNVDANQVGFSLGTNIKFDTKSTMFLKVSQVVEKDLFSGLASDVDPVSGQKPSGVSVTNSFTLIQLGYTWGN